LNLKGRSESQRRDKLWTAWAALEISDPSLLETNISIIAVRLRGSLGLLAFCLFELVIGIIRFESV